jgi:hypothetical protein
MENIPKSKQYKVNSPLSKELDILKDYFKGEELRIIEQPKRFELMWGSI